MNKTLHTTLFFLTFAYFGARGQDANLYIIPSSVQMQVQGKSGELVPFYYRVIYHADVATKQPFTGWIHTFFESNHNTIPGEAFDSASTSENVFGGGPLMDGDTMGVYGHFKIDAGYFRNGTNNIIVIWPTGHRSGSQSIIKCSDSVKITKNILVSGLTGINDKSSADQIVKIYPNPANTYFSIESTDPGLKISELKLFDITGKEIFFVHEVNDKVDISHIRSGTYYVEITCSDSRVARYPLIISR